MLEDFMKVEGSEKLKRLKGLIDRGLVQTRTSTEERLSGLTLYKYSRKVFTDNLWDEDNSALTNCRGLVLDSSGEVVVAPFQKVFNLGERGTSVPSHEEVLVIEKVNGFLGVVTPTSKYGIIYSTTGSLDGDHVDMVKKAVQNLEGTSESLKGEDLATYMFEIVDKNDPHIVTEELGAHLIGARLKTSGKLLDEGFVDWIADSFKSKRPSSLETTFSEAKTLASETKLEGYMIRRLTDGEVLCKIKSPHYLKKKFLMRIGKRFLREDVNFQVKLDTLIEENEDEEFDLVFKMLKKLGNEGWAMLGEQQRRVYIESILGGAYID